MAKPQKGESRVYLEQTQKPKGTTSVNKPDDRDPCVASSLLKPDIVRLKLIGNGNSMTKSILGFHVKSLHGTISIEFQVQSCICLEQLGTDRPFSSTPVWV